MHAAVIDADRSHAPGARRRCARGAALALLFTGTLAAAQVLAAPRTPVQAVEHLHEVLAGNMAQGATLGFDGRLARIEQVLASTFDFELIAQAMLGARYAELDPAQRSRFRALVERNSALTYAGRFKSMAHSERFVTVEEQPVRGGRVVVRTRLERDDGSPVTLDYVVQPDARGARIVNVIADGVSDLSLKRAEYAAVIRKNGVDGLLQRLEQQVAELAREGAAGG